MSRLVKRVGDYMASAPREAANVLREAT
jgi:hypothetical protein